MSLTFYRTVLFALYGLGFATATAYLVLYRAWRLRRWRTVAARENSGLILVLWAVYGWLIYRLVEATAAGRGQVPASPHLWIGLAVFVLIDGYFAQRLWHYHCWLREERLHPTVPCPRCDGRGVVHVVAD